ncbi:MAG: type I 3-dehydroquinate dehydratase [Candidatus Aenigmarchaeota archaeon]|nr:type I 3-dehydroquinate dehydratase [Candidatus Aenigmarchaeota archaeon]
MRACAVLAGKSMQELLQKASDARQRGADFVEILLNGIEDYSNFELIESFPLPVILSVEYTKNRKTADALKKALKFRTEFVDIDLEFPKNFIESTFAYARANGIKTIVSYRPETFPLQKNLKKIMDDMAVLSKYMKIVLPAKSKKDIESFDGIFAGAAKTGAKLALVSSFEPAPADRRNFIAYGKTESSSHNRHLPQIEDVKKSIISSAGLQA